MCFSGNGSVCLVCCVFVNYLENKFAIFVGVVVILLLNVMGVLCVGGGDPLDKPCMVSPKNVYDYSVLLDVPSLCFVYVGSNLLIYEFESWITGVCAPYDIS